MTLVVTENCIKCKYTTCVDVCPVDCFKEGPLFLVIDPNECIDCDMCLNECEANAIFNEFDLPEDQKQFLEINARLAEEYDYIYDQKPALPDADHWNGVKDKLKYLEL